MKSKKVFSDGNAIDGNAPPHQRIFSLFDSSPCMQYLLKQNTIYFSPFYLFFRHIFADTLRVDDSHFVANKHRTVSRIRRTKVSCFIVSTDNAHTHTQTHTRVPPAPAMMRSVFIVSSPKIITNFLVTNCLLSSYKISLVHYLFAIQSRHHSRFLPLPPSLSLSPWHTKM